MSVFTRRLICKVRHQSGAVTYATPKAVAMDYRSNSSDFGGTVFDATALALHKKYKFNVLNMQVSQAAPAAAGYTFVQSLVADDPNRKVYQYTIASQTYDSDFGAPTYSPIYNAINAGGTSGGSWWAKDAGTGNKTKTGTAQGFNMYEVNLCPAYTTANASGLKAAEVIADGLKSMLLDNLKAAGLAGVFNDNVWGSPGAYTQINTKSYPGAVDMGANVVADYDLNGTNDTRTNSDWATRNNAPNVEWRKGLANYVSRLRTGTGYSNFQVIANGDFDATTDATFGNASVGTTELNGVYNFSFIEGLTSYSGGDSPCIAAYRGQFKDVLNRVYTAHDNVTGGGAIIGAYIQSSVDTLARTLQKCRMALGVAMLADAYCAVSDRPLGSSSVMRPYWFKELEQQIGTATGSRPTADNLGTTGYDGMCARTYTNGLVVVNPSSNKGRWMANAGGTLTLNRSSNVVTLTWSAMPAAVAAAITDGVTKVRIQDCSTDSTFNGIFTITGHTSTSITWAQTAANASLSKPQGYFGIQSTVDLTGQGYKRITGDDSGSVSAYNAGTASQNDGTTVTTLSLWPNDAILLLKA